MWRSGAQCGARQAPRGKCRMSDAAMIWPALPYPAWRDTATTLHLWTQIVGKVRLALTPWVNHSWQVPLYVTARGLGTSPIAAKGELFEMEFDFIGHGLIVRGSWGAERTLALEPQSVADFYRRVVALLDDMGIAVRIGEMPNEIANPVSFPEDHVHAAYDPDAAHALWRVLIQADRIFKLFRSGFLGKASPVHFFWGSFDLAVTRFSGLRGGGTLMYLHMHRYFPEWADRPSGPDAQHEAERNSYLAGGYADEFGYGAYPDGPPAIAPLDGDPESSALWREQIGALHPGYPQCPKPLDRYRREAKLEECLPAEAGRTSPPPARLAFKVIAVGARSQMPSGRAGLRLGLVAFFAERLIRRRHLNDVL